MRKKLNWFLFIIGFTCLAVQVMPQEYVYRAMNYLDLFSKSDAASNISQLQGYYGKIGNEDITWGSTGVETYTVPKAGGGTITLTKLPSLVANVASIIKGKWYVSTSSSITNHGTVGTSGSLAWVAATVGTDPCTIELPPGNYAIGTDLTLAATIAIDPMMGAMIMPASGKTLTINKLKSPGRWQWIDPTNGNVVFGSGAVSKVKAEWWCSATDGIVDNTSAFTKAAASITQGVIELDTAKYYLASSITLPAHVSIKGVLESIGSSRYATFDYTSVLGAIYLANTATINLGSGSTLSNVLIVNKDLIGAYPFANLAAAQAAIAGFYGTAIYVNQAEDVYLHNIRILGFAQAIHLLNSDRTKIEWVDIDCTAGILADNVRDIARIYNVHAWNFLTYYYAFASSVEERTGAAFKVVNHFDGSGFSNCFSWGHTVGFDMQAPTGVTLANCWVEGGATFKTGSIGYKFTTAGDQYQMLGCKVDTMDIGVYVNRSSVKLAIADGSFHGCNYSIKAEQAAELSIRDSQFWYLIPAGSGTGWSAVSHIYLDGVSGSVAINDNYIYGLSGTGIELHEMANVVNIANNRILGCTTGIIAEVPTGVGVNPNSLVVTGNNFAGTTTAYTIDAAYNNWLTFKDNVAMAADTIGDWRTGPSTESFLSTGSAGPIHNNYRQTGTASSPLPVSANDVLGVYKFWGLDSGHVWREAARITAYVNGTPGSNDMPGSIVFATTPDGAGAPVNAVSINNVPDFFPSTDNASKCGGTSFRWTAVYAVNGTIQTSDERQKTDIVDTDLGLDFVKALQPIDYKWKVDKNKVVGQEWLDASGKKIKEGEKIPANAKAGSVKTEPVAGTKKHHGFSAQAVKAVADAMGKEFGGIEIDENTGEYGMNYAEFIPILVTAIQEQQKQIEELKKGK